MRSGFGFARPNTSSISSGCFRPASSPCWWLDIGSQEDDARGFTQTVSHPGAPSPREPCLALTPRRRWCWRTLPDTCA